MPSEIVPFMILRENIIGQVLALDTDPLRPREGGMEIKSKMYMVIQRRVGSGMVRLIRIFTTSRSAHRAETLPG